MAPQDLREVAQSSHGGALEKSARGSTASSLKSYPFRPQLQGGSVSIDPTGRRVLALDPDGGTLAMVDTRTLAVTKTVTVCDGPEQVVAAADGGAFVTCRGDGRTLSLDKELDVVAETTLGGEPFGLALTADGKTLLVTTAADAKLHALDPGSLAVRWTRTVAAQPRGVSVSVDGKQAAVAHLMGGGPTLVSLDSAHSTAVPLPRTRDGWPNELLAGESFETKAIARLVGGGYAAVMSPGGTRAFIPYALKNNGEGIESFIPGCYANGSQLPVAPSFAAVNLVDSRVQRPEPLPLKSPSDRFDFGLLNAMGRLGVVRAAVHDPVRSRLLVVGEGSGMLMALDTSKADPSSTPLAYWELGSPARGIAVDRNGARAFVHLALDHQLAVVALHTMEADTKPTMIKIGKDGLSPDIALGRKLFHAANDRRVAGITGVSCASCHVEGRSDGVTWRLDGHGLQTPLLAGRSDFHGQLRWSGASPDLTHAVAEAIKRLQGSGLPPRETAALAAFLLSGASDMKLPASPHAGSERGREVFTEAGCANCHLPANGFSDGKLHAFRGKKYRTPSLRGLFSTAPYYHDGSVPTLTALLGAHEKGNPMAVGNRLEAADRQALEAFLRSL